MKEKSLFEGYEFNRQKKENWLGEPTIGEYAPVDDIPIGGPEWRKRVVIEEPKAFLEELKRRKIDVR